MANEQYELYQQGTAAELAEALLALLDGKADIDGYYAQLTAGAADNLTGRGDATTAEFLYRTAGGTADIETGQAVVKSIHGRTVRWNQLVKTTDFATVTSNGVTFTNNGDGSITINGTATDMSFISHNYEIVTNHVYLYRMSPAGGSDATYFGDSGMSTGRDYGSGRIGKFTGTSGAKYLRTYVTGGTTVTNLTFHPQLFDLTAMFGAGNEPTTVAEFEALFPEPYYPYDAGSLLPVNMTGIETVGFNQWDEEWELGGINQSTGLNFDANDRIRSKNFIPVFPDTEYCISSPSSVTMRYYDADKSYIGAYDKANSGDVSSPYGTKTTPSNCRYVKFATYNTYGTTYNNDICINLSWSGRRNGEYEAFWKSQRLIDAATYFPDGMHSAGSVYDELTSTEAIQRVGVDTLNFPVASRPDGNGKLSWTFNVTNNITGLPSNVLPNIKCDKYATETRDNVIGVIKPSNSICIAFTAATTSAEQALAVCDSNVETATLEEARTYFAAHPFTVYYALATPTVTTIDPPLNLTYRVDDFGTERVMVPTGERSAPPVLSIAYGLNVVDFVRRAPSEYISAASFRQYLIARDAHDGTTTTMTWDDTDNRYEFTITDVETEG